MQNNRDIWVVIFDDNEELFLLKKQIESLILFKNTLTYNIIINADNVRNVRKKMKKIGILNLLETAKFSYNVFSKFNFLKQTEQYTTQKRDGYISQQLLKLQIYRRSYAKEHLILDSKTIILNPLAITIDEPNRDISRPINFFACYEYFINKWHNGNIISTKGTATPFLFKNNILESLEIYFKSRTAYINELTQSFYISSKHIKQLALRKNKNYVDKGDCLSEFLIYNLFEQKINPRYVPTRKKPSLIRLYQNDDRIQLKDFIIEADVLLFHRKFVKKIGIERAEEIIDTYLSIANEK